MVVVLTFNCEAIVGQTLAQALRLCTRPFVVDSHSTDRTVEIARSLGCQVVQRPFKNYSEQRNWAIAEVAGLSRWQLHLDADEVLDDAAVREITAIAASSAPGHRAYMIRRIDCFMGRQLRHSGLNPWHLRLFMSGHGVCEDRLYDQHFIADAPAGRLRGCMHDKTCVSLSDWTARHNRWSDLEVAELARGLGAKDSVLKGRLRGDPRERMRWLKGLYYRLPGGVRSLAYFGYRYVLRLGFLDGREGFYFAALQAFWFRVLVDAKAYERSKAMPAEPTPAAAAAEVDATEPGRPTA
ncbi:MAG: glycosyltransferase family 2 protein [Chitinophagaceae bacterium]|nr:glycosyltransferase family 2 protein [Rubrivivax sp.]